MEIIAVCCMNLKKGVTAFCGHNAVLYVQAKLATVF